MTTTISPAKAHFIIQEKLAEVASGQGFTGRASEDGEDTILVIERGGEVVAEARYKTEGLVADVVTSFVQAAAESEDEGGEADGGC